MARSGVLPYPNFVVILGAGVVSMDRVGYTRVLQEDFRESSTGPPTDPADGQAVGEPFACRFA